MYKQALDIKKEEIEDEKSRKRNLISKEIEKVKRKKQELQSFIDGLEKKVEKYYDKAEKDHCIESMMKGNSFRNTLKEKKKLISDLALSLEELEKDKHSV